MPQRPTPPASTPSCRSGAPCLTSMAGQSGHLPSARHATRGGSGAGVCNPRSPHASRNDLSRRRGISLLEVLISMFILLIGLLGVGALIPVGRLEVGKGDQYDRAGALGRAAFREMKVRGMLRPDASLSPIGSLVPMWFTFDAGNYTSTAHNPFSTTYYSAGNNGSMSNGTPPVPVQDGLPYTKEVAGPPTSMPAQAGYALDPWGFAYNATQIYNNLASASTGTAIPTMAQFPVGPAYPNTALLPNALSLTRITMRASNALTDGVMPLGQAARIFQAEDDLVFAQPPTDFAGAQILYYPLNKAQKRLSDGNYSWMATVVPNSPTVLLTTGTLTNNQQYTVSVVVYYKRPISLALNVAAAGETVPVYPERVALVTFPTNPTGVSGGEVQLSVPTAGGNPATPGASYLNLKLGQWIMLAGQTTLPASGGATATAINPTSTAAPMNIFRWYRVVAMDNIYDTGRSVAVVPGAGANAATGSGATFTRNVTLAGPDWPVQEILNNQLPAGGPFNTQTYAFICDGVVAVYEKTMPLERSSPWSTQ